MTRLKREMSHAKAKRDTHRRRDRLLCETSVVRFEFMTKRPKVMLNPSSASPLRRVGCTATIGIAQAPVILVRRSSLG